MAKLRFEGQVAWVTGASSGIGRELARAFFREGADVAISARRADRLEALAEEARAAGRRALVVTCDVAQEADVREAVTQIIAHFGRLDVAVANAGCSVAGRIDEL